MAQNKHMVFRIFKVIWIISLIAVCGVFFYAYSALPDQVSLGTENNALSKSAFFYLFIGVLALFNGTAFSVSRLIRQPWKLSWYFGMLSCLHLFLISTFIFLAILNSSERYDYSRLGPTVIGSFIVFVLWIAAFPMVPFFTKSAHQESVS